MGTANCTEAHLKSFCKHIVWVKENFFDSNSSNLGDCEDASAITGKGTQEEKTGLFFQFYKC